ncbi:conjugal transfer protein TraF [Methylomonas sp. UP202]|uniref:conjugal transfer protein TraF n=1 Tax=Methylomonas sp. UP202 TaxID=3040943 RepID=UPI002479853A|nr:conjugal transfer protein TraF [Methylomonas sp. UP202]WGS88668.1 conjugal transfer protein TraF [Methylomonas sp. UP202]
MFERLLTVFCLLLLPCAALSDQAEPSFFLDKQRGWFWRELSPEPSIEQTPSPSETEEKISSHPQKQEMPPPEPAQPPAYLSAEWFRKNLEHYKDAAIDSPTEQNVLAYYYLQRVMMDKAQRFANVAQRVVMADPRLDENNRRPLATFASNAANQRATQANEQAMSTIAKQAGLLFFFRSDCHFCEAQAPLLSVLEQRFGFKVYPVSLDGKPMPSGFYKQFRTDTGQALALGVMSTPALFLMKPPNEILPVAQGVVSLDDLTSRVLLSAKHAGWISEPLFNTARGVTDSSFLLPEAGVLTEPVMNDAGRLVEALRRQPLRP